MTYFLVSIQTLSTGQTPSSIAGYGVLEDAISAFHATLASNYISDLDGFTVMVMDQNGVIYKKESYIKPQPAPEPEPEEVTEY